MFAYTGLSEAQVERLTKEFNIFLLKSGRISMAGVADTGAGSFDIMAFLIGATPSAARVWMTDNVWHAVLQDD